MECYILSLLKEPTQKDKELSYDLKICATPMKNNHVDYGLFLMKCIMVTDLIMLRLI